MKLGGYKIIDFKGKDCDAHSASGKTGATIAGIYDSIESTRKATLLSGLVDNTTEFGDFYGTFTVSGTDFIITLPNGNLLTIDDDDLCAITVPEEPVSATV